MDTFEAKFFSESRGINFMNVKHTYLQRTLLILCFIVGLLLAGVASAGDSMNVLQPAVAASNMEKPGAIRQDSRPYVNKLGTVFFAADIFLPRSRSSGKRVAAARFFRGHSLAVSFFSDRKYNITVDSESRPRPDILSLNGHLEGSSIATFSLTVTPESYLIRFQDLNDAIMYRVVGETGTGEGRVTEIDLRKMPSMQELAPLIPPGK